MYNKKQSGITLIALVVTIVILLILSGISINLLAGDNGLIARSKKATENHEIASITERLEQTKAELAIDKTSTGGAVTVKDFVEQAVKDGIITQEGVMNSTPITEDTTSATIKVNDKYIYTVTQNGNDVDVNYKGTSDAIKETLNGATLQLTYSWVTANSQKVPQVVVTKGGTVSAEAKIQYQVNGYADNSWNDLTSGNKILNAKVNGTERYMQNNDVVYVRLELYGSVSNASTITIKDTVAPTVSLQTSDVTSDQITVTVAATDNESGLPNPVTYKYYIAKSSESYSSTPTVATNTNTNTFTGLTASTEYKIKVEVADKANNVGNNETTATTKIAETAGVDSQEITNAKNETIMKAKTEATTVTDSLENTLKVPAGFMIKEGSNVEDGIVIIDISDDEATQGNEFVWVPVGTGIKKLDGTTVNIPLGRYTFDSNGKETLLAGSSYKEETAEEHANSTIDNNVKQYGKNEIAKDIEAFISSANTNHGYYIARYEASKGTQTKDVSLKIKEGHYVDENGNTTSESGYYVDENGNTTSESGYYVDENGNTTSESGHYETSGGSCNGCSGGSCNGCSGGSCNGCSGGSCNGCSGGEIWVDNTWVDNTWVDNEWVLSPEYETRSYSVIKTQENKPVWNDVRQWEASATSRSMYSNNKVTSDLINSYAWDTAILFIEKCGKEGNSANYANQIGLSTTVNFAQTGVNLLKSTNAVDKQCNIFDMAGNILEWSSETYSYTSIPCTNRGGVYYDRYSHTSYRYYCDTIITINYLGFRPLLYL